MDSGQEQIKGENMHWAEQAVSDWKETKKLNDKVRSLEIDELEELIGSAGLPEFDEAIRNLMFEKGADVGQLGRTH